MKIVDITNFFVRNSTDSPEPNNANPKTQNLAINLNKLLCVQLQQPRSCLCFLCTTFKQIYSVDECENMNPLSFQVCLGFFVSHGIMDFADASSHFPWIVSHVQLIDSTVFLESIASADIFNTCFLIALITSYRIVECAQQRLCSPYACHYNSF